jgi:hypothetical protein
MQPIRAAGLPALGINRRLPLSVVHGPQLYPGLGIPDLWTVQGTLKLCLALQHGDAPTITGHQLQASMELHTVELGLSGQLLQQDYKILGSLATTSWLKHLWEFCDNSNIQLTTTTPKLHIVKEHDDFLMEKFAAFGYGDKQLSQLNLCRMWCHAVRLSDISTGDGRQIHPLSWNGNPTDTPGTEYEWPAQGCPTTKLWDLWQSDIRHCYLTPDTTLQLLCKPLGPWTRPTPQQWHWFYSPSTDRVYQKLDEHFQMYSVIPNGRRLRNSKLVINSISNELPDDAEQTTITAHSNMIWCHGSQPLTYEASIATNVNDLVQDNDLWAIRSFSCPENGKALPKLSSEERR